MLRTILLVALAPIAVYCAASVSVELKPNCFATDDGGCKCDVKEGTEVTSRKYDSISECKKSVELQTSENKKDLNDEIKRKYGDLKDNCFPNPSGGCKCQVDEGHGEVTKKFTEDADCKKSIEAQTVENKKELNEEINEKFGDFKENCFPKPSGGCKCQEKDSEGNEVTALYNDPEQCKVRVKRDVRTGEVRPAAAEQATKYRSRSQSPPSQNVRDPVRERAQANYKAVVNELNQKFKGLKEGCYPRPKGCLCVTGKTANGRDITERRMKDSDCKCKEGDRSPGCPAA